MTGPDFYIGQGDTASPLFETLEDENGAPVDIQGATVNVTITPIGGGAAIVSGAANNLQVGDGSDGSKGDVSYGEGAHPWGAATATAGLYLYQWTVTYGGGTIQTFPNDGYRLLQITSDAPTSAQRYASLDELKSTLNLRGTTYANADLSLALSAAARTIETFTGRVFTAAGGSTTRKYTPTSWRYCLIDDAVTVTNVTSNLVSWVQDTDYVLVPSNLTRPSPPYSAIKVGLYMSGQQYRWFYPEYLYSVSVTGTFGWPSVPDEIKQANIILAGRLVKRAREAPFGILAFGDEGEAMRITRADPDLNALLQPYISGWSPVGLLA